MRRDLFAGGETTCAIRPAGVLWCWCDNEYGDLGIGSTKPSFSWVEVTLP